MCSPISDRLFRRAALLAALALAGCGGSGGGKAAGQAIECRLPGKPGFEKLCTVDRTGSPEGTVLIVRLPDGGFRRLLIVRDGRGVIAADGAEPVTVRKGEGDMIELDTPEGSFRLHARITP